MSKVEKEIREASRALWDALWEKDQLTYREKVEAMEAVLSMEPPAEWVKTLMGGIKYLPIERIEWLLSTIYGRFTYDIISYTSDNISAGVSVRVNVFNPVFNEWESLDGVGAAPLEAIHGSQALAMALPSAKTFAVKDAVEPLGKIFGKDLRRPESITVNSAKEDMEAVSGPLIRAFQSYKGADKVKVKERMMEANKNGWPEDIVEELKKKLKVA